VKFSFVGPSYTAQSNVIADEECINLFAETNETPGAQTQRSYLGTPGLGVFTSLADSPIRGQCLAGNRLFVVAGPTLTEIFSDGGQAQLGDVGNTDNGVVSIVNSNIQLLIVSSGRAFCYTFADSSLVEVTSQLAGIPKQAEFTDTYFVVSFVDSNKFQVSDILDGTSWPGIQVNAVSVFAENITGIRVSHRELWIMGSAHIQVYRNMGSDEVFDPIDGAFIDTGLEATFGQSLVDNTIFWIGHDQRGARQAWRANGYTPQRFSTHAVETYLAKLADISGMVSYAYQDGGHLFWVLYIPSTDCSWVYDVAENMWHKRASWNQQTAKWGPHWSWNHTFAFGRHLVGDWQSGNLYEMSLSFYDDSGQAKRWLRRTPTLVKEMQWIYHNSLVIDVAPGLGPQPDLVDGEGNPRPPQIMLRWSDDRGSTWSNEYMLDCGFAGDSMARAIMFRLGRSRYRVYEISGTDPIPWTVVDAYLEAA